jgi:hypothetical protein
LDEGTGLVANATDISKASVYHARNELKGDGKSQKAKQWSEKHVL